MERTNILKQLIEDTGISMKAFSEEAGIPYTTLRSILERGIGNASVDNVIKICSALNITIDELEEMANNKIQDPIIKPKTIAAHLPDGVKLTEEEEEDIRNFVSFVLSQREEKNNKED